MNVENYEVLQAKNPFQLQNKQLPIIISLLVLIIPIFVSFFVNNVKSLMMASFILLLYPVIIAFVIKLLYGGGIERVYFNSYFDSSYFNVCVYHF